VIINSCLPKHTQDTLVSDLEFRADVSRVTVQSDGIVSAGWCVSWDLDLIASSVKVKAGGESEGTEVLLNTPENYRRSVADTGGRVGGIPGDIMVLPGNPNCGSVGVQDSRRPNVKRSGADGDRIDGSRNGDTSSEDGGELHG